MALLRTVDGPAAPTEVKLRRPLVPVSGAGGEGDKVFRTGGTFSPFSGDVLAWSMSFKQVREYQE